MHGCCVTAVMFTTEMRRKCCFFLQMAMVRNTTFLNVIQSDDEEDDGYVPYDQRPETYIVPVVFLLILVVGVIGNGILVFTLLCDANMRNVPNTYVLSLALGDLLVIITCVPFTSFLYTIESWPWGLAVCKLSECAKDISIGVSVFTLTALSAERYCAIVNPIRRHVAGLSAKPLTILIACLIWILAIILAMPAAFFSHVPIVPLLNNNSILICSPFPEEFVFVDSSTKATLMDRIATECTTSRGWIDGEVAPRFDRISVRMKRYSSVSGSRSYVSLGYASLSINSSCVGVKQAPCLADRNNDNKKARSMERVFNSVRAHVVFMQEPNAKEYLQLALARILELQREIKDGTYATDHTSDLGNKIIVLPNSFENHQCPQPLAELKQLTYGIFPPGESSSEEDLTKEVLRKVFKNLPGTPDSAEAILNRAAKNKPSNSQLEAIHGKRIQLLGYDTCRRTAVEFMKNVARETRRDGKSSDSNYSGFRLGIYSRNEPRVAHRRTGLRRSSSSCDQEIRDRMLRSLDLHLASKQRDYTAKLMRSGT
ncbi:hypothetical protein E2986_11344 [Frieseomelitta varia]|uniref:G-protein coupled receptors family 1 profile domain-containing protein n=1 Tax=Frieseomelitta varia TaxID=561572 RepID=A0A833RNL1_9HYME|nr:hypothetical protein E2986_11344 [Frieseomelitta varia]